MGKLSQGLLTEISSFMNLCFLVFRTSGKDDPCNQPFFFVVVVVVVVVVVFSEHNRTPSGKKTVTGVQVITASQVQNIECRW